MRIRFDYSAGAVEFQRGTEHSSNNSESIAVRESLVSTQS